MSYPFFSVIIPCYNCYDFVKRALHSLESQTLQDFEVILVDDASTDESYEFLQDYVSKSRFDVQLYRNAENRGPGYSRNYAISKARGKYLTFLDTDDWYEANLLLSVYNEIIEKQSDLVLFDYYRAFNEKDRRSMLWTNILPEHPDLESVLALSFDSLCTICVKKKNFYGLEIPTLHNAEDSVTVPLIVSNVKTITVLKEPLYNYYYRFNSLSSSKNKDIASSFCEAYSFLENRLPIEFKEALEYRGVLMIIYGAVFKSIEAGVSPHHVSKLIENFTVAHPHYLSNKYLKYLPRRKRVFIELASKKCFFCIKIYIAIHLFFLRLPSITDKIRRFLSATTCL